MYKYVIEKLKDIYNYLKNICMSLNFEYVFICRIFFLMRLYVIQK